MRCLWGNKKVQCIACLWMARRPTHSNLTGELRRGQEIRRSRATQAVIIIFAKTTMNGCVVMVTCAMRVESQERRPLNSSPKASGSLLDAHAGVLAYYLHKNVPRDVWNVMQQKPFTLLKCTPPNPSPRRTGQFTLARECTLFISVFFWRYRSASYHANHTCRCAH